MSIRSQSSTQRWWYGQIEQLAFARLHALQRLRDNGRPPLWDGMPPVPVEHVAEHLIGLSIVFEEIQEAEGEEILGCLRPDTREIVLNDRHGRRFRDVPGCERHTIAHEVGHADVFGDVAATAQPAFPGLVPASHTRKRSSTKGDVRVLSLRCSAAMNERLRRCTPEVRAEVLRQFELDMRAREQSQVAAGADTPLVRRAVSHYAATLLMPADLIRREAKELDLSRWSSVDHLARRFVVSRESMRIQLEYLNLIHGVSDQGRILVRDPAEEAQLSIL